MCNFIASSASSRALPAARLGPCSALLYSNRSAAVTCKEHTQRPLQARHSTLQCDLFAKSWLYAVHQRPEAERDIFAAESLAELSVQCQLRWLMPGCGARDSAAPGPVECDWSVPGRNPFSRQHSSQITVSLIPFGVLPPPLPPPHQKPHSPK